jgi:hypothetical protein
MELTSKSNELIADDIRPLSDIELDDVNGGGILLAGAFVLLACAGGLVLGKCSK